MKSLFVSWIAAACLALLAGVPAFAQGKPIRILALGDSLTAGYGLPGDQSFTSALQRALKSAGYENVIVNNAGVSGDTSTGGLARLDWALGDGTDAAIVELGANDMLRGINPNIEKMIVAFRGKGTEVMLAVMVSSDNWGQTYKKEFDSIYPELASRYGVALVPFMMAGVWGDPKLLIGDGLHPNAAGVARMTDVLAPPVQNLLASMSAGAPAGK